MLRYSHKQTYFQYKLFLLCKNTKPLFSQTIDKDVRRTERKHPFFAEEGCVGLRMLRRLLITLSVYDPELAYVQGMNEICAPILLTLQVTLLGGCSMIVGI